MKRLSLFVGAGFSKWAANLPVASQLFDFGFKPLGVREESRFEYVLKMKRDWDILHPNETAEKFIAKALTFPAKYREAVLWYIVRRLSEPFVRVDYFKNKKLRRHVLYIDEPRGRNVYDYSGKPYRKFDWSPIRKAERFFYKLETNFAGIITTNYDLLIEYSLGSQEFNYGTVGEQLSGKGVSFRFYSFDGSELEDVILLGTTPVAKLHGSISWDGEKKYVDGRCGLSGKALIVAPTPEKTPPASLSAVWDLSAQILRQTTHLIVFGFAFNSYDEAILNHLKDHGRTIESVLLIDIAPKIESASLLWQNARIDSALPATEDLSSDMVIEWLGKTKFLG